ncbi:MAG: biotin--[acetyl-CoA-carboxylase] ligase [Bacteroidia bacterium]|nr:biotin--[acetyl-CoA-carboxylase] ligase [Bacteroidia bacterium]
MVKYIGENYFFFEELASTNTFLNQLDAADTEEGTVVQAAFQTHGKGQKGSVWLVEPGQNLTLSILLKPTFLELKRIFQLSKVAALALHHTILHFLPDADVKIKWPNDMLLNGKKVAGILLENQLESKRINASIIGLGLNVNQAGFPTELTEKATSLRLESGWQFSLDEIRAVLFEKMEYWYEHLKKGEHSMVDRPYLKYLFGYQEEVDVEIEGKKIKAMMVGIGTDGRVALVVDDVLKYFGIKEVRWIL